jgi:hypothetical protein
LTKLGIYEYEYKYESKSPSPYILFLAIIPSFLDVTLLFPIIISSIMLFHSLFSPHHPLAFPTIPCYRLVHPTISFLTIFHHPIVPPLSLVIPIVIRWWSFVVWTKPPKQLLLIQNFYQDIQIKTSYKSMFHLEMSLGTSFQNMEQP